MNYTCPNEVLLSEHLEGTLSPAKAQEIAAHLQTCGTCQSTLEDMAQLSALLTSYERPEPPPELVASYKASLKKIAQSRTPLRRIASRIGGLLEPLINPRPVGWKIAQVAAVLAIGILIGSQFLSENGTAPETVREPSIVVLSVTPEDIRFMNSYLNKSEILLLAMANSQDQVSRASGDIHFSKNVAQNLLQQTRAMEQRATKLDNIELSAYLTRLEQVLLEVANMDLDSGVYTMSELKSAIAEKQLILQSQRFQDVMASIEQRSI